VIGNLLSNAATYTEPGGRITVTLEHDGDQAVLRVRDTGIGISAEMLPRVFDLFAQADQALDRSQGGLGIGLTLVKQLVELHGGEVEAHSDGLNRGAEFVVRLPAVVHEKKAAAPASGPGAGDHGRARVLIVEDNADAAESMLLLLELLGHHVRVAGDGPSALEAARANPPDVMLVDIGLPGMDGYELARHVRQDEHLRRVILVALTGYGREEDRQQAFAAGFDYHLVKPVDIDKFQGLVAQLVAPPKQTTLH
jgi:two-component system CheB/CheR fusion protein